MTCSSFEITKVRENFPKPVVFRLTGETSGYGCLGQSLTLSVDGKDYAMENGPLACGHVDAALFRVQRNAEGVTVEFTKKGETLLKPGATVWCRADTGW
jgi:hypothetical protein